MGIRSPFHDYYDTALAHGSDPSRMFMRNPEKSVLKLDRDGDGVWDRYSRLAGIADAFELEHGGVYFDACVVLFCGRVYKALRVHRMSSPKPNEASERVFYDASDARRYLEGLLGQERMKQKRESFLEFDSPLGSGTLVERLERYFQQQGSVEMMQWSVENRIAIAVLCIGGRFEKSTLQINPSLKHVQFYRLFGPAEAFQELDMFWGGVLAAESRPTPGISDKARIAQHGFDDRSFRKDPSSKR